MKPLARRPPRLSLLVSHPTRPPSCLFCQYRLLYTSPCRSQQQQQQQQQQKQEPTPSVQKPHKLPSKPTRPHVRARDGELIPKPLSRPLGLEHPPQPGQNSGRDTRSWKQRRDDYADYDKHLARRQGLIHELYQKNYFRDIGNLGGVYRGKSILAPQTPFRAHLALYFPNLVGRTLDPHAPSAVDTTPALRGRVSVVSVLNTEWAKAQCATFVGAEANPALHEVLAGEGAGVTQLVEVSVEENWLKAWLIRLFMWRIRRAWRRENWGRYFLVTRGLNDGIREALGMWNGKVGYVYLLDGNCKVRWAGNGEAKDEEKTYMVNCLKRLVAEAKGGQKFKVNRQDPKPTGQAAKEDTQQKVPA